MRKCLFIVLLVLIFVNLCSCGDVSKASEETVIEEAVSESTFAVTPTGVLDGQYEQPMVYYHDNLYCYSFQGVQTTLASRYVVIGSISKVDMYEIPTEDFCATGVDIKPGQEVYADSTDNPSIIFINLGDSYMPLRLEK